NLLAFGLTFFNERLSFLGKLCRQIALDDTTLKLSSQFRMSSFISRKFLTPCLLCCRTFRLGIPGSVDIVGYNEVSMRPLQLLTHQGRFINTQWSAVGFVGALLIGRAVTDDGFGHNQGRFAGFSARFLDSRFDS